MHAHTENVLRTHMGKILWKAWLKVLILIGTALVIVVSSDEAAASDGCLGETCSRCGVIVFPLNGHIFEANEPCLVTVSASDCPAGELVVVIHESLVLAKWSFDEEKVCTCMCMCIDS
jgi:hypothetical protein